MIRMIVTHIRALELWVPLRKQYLHNTRRSSNKYWVTFTFCYTAVILYDGSIWAKQSPTKSQAKCCYKI